MEILTLKILIDFNSRGLPWQRPSVISKKRFRGSLLPLTIIILLSLTHRAGMVGAVGKISAF